MVDAGQYNPSVKVVAKSTALLRMTYTGGARFMILMLEKEGREFCNVTLIARDGIFHQKSYINVTRWAFHPGNDMSSVLSCVVSCLTL